MLTRINKYATSGAVWCIFVTVFVVVRRNAILSRMTINPDEAELLAAGKRAAMSFVPFKDFTVPTYGPAWPMFLGTLHRFGLPLTLPVAHLLSALAGAACCAMLLLALRRSAGWGWALVVVLPLLAHWSVGFNSPDFIAMATETLPVCFLVAACVVGFPSSFTSQRRAMGAAVLFGFVVWGKYFFAPVVLVGLAALIVLLSRSGVSPLRSVVVVGSASAAPYVVAATTALVAGVPFWKVSESIVFNWNYTRAGGLLGASYIDPSARFQVAWKVAGSLSSVSVIAVLVVIALVARLFGRSIALKSIDAVLFVFALASVVVASALLYELYPIFPHYSYVFVGGCLQAVLLCRTALPRLSPHAMLSSVGRGVASLSAGLSLTALALLVPTYVVQHVSFPGTKTTWSKLLSSDGGRMVRAFSTEEGGSPLESLCPRGSRVLSWGWYPDAYSYYDWKPASRYVVTTYQISPNMIATDVAVYRPRLVEELVANPPDCMIDATQVSGWWAQSSDVSLVNQIPEIFDQIPRAYVEHQMVWDLRVPVTVYVGG